MHFDINWRFHQRTPKKKRVRLKRKERMNWQQWLQDWYQALHSQGWTCRNPGITSERKRLTEAELSQLRGLYMQKDKTVVCLYAFREEVPGQSGNLDEWVNCIKPIDHFIRIVRGRRPNPQRAVVHLENGTATNIIPIHPPFDYAPFLVEFDGGLFTPTGRGDWQQTQDAPANEVYASYLEASPHLHSFRNYTPKLLVPHVCLHGRGANVVGERWTPLKRLK